MLLSVVALPYALLAGNAWAAESGLEDAIESLVEGDLEAASKQVEAAREDAQDLDRATRGPVGWVWGLLPGAEQDKTDVRRLSRAFEDVTSVVEIAVEAYPQNQASQGFLLQAGGGIDVDALKAELDQFDRIRDRVASAHREARQVNGGPTPLGFVLARVATGLEAPLGQALEVMDLAQPLVPVLPTLLGADEPQTLLIALLNPSEQRYSGGAALSFRQLEFDEGTIAQGDSVIGAEGPETFRRLRWRPVRNNPFHDAGDRLRLSTANLAPSWSVSGEELLRAWEKAQGVPMDGLLAINVLALQDLMRFTGPIDVPGYGRLDAATLTEQLVGSYEAYTTPDIFLERRAGSAQLMDEFQKRLVSASSIVGKMDSVISSAAARRFAGYHRDARVQASFDEMGLSGDLSTTTHDYSGVFNQATTGHKADYWQRRRVSHEVWLRPDGSARVEDVITIHNDSPPPATDVFPGYAQYVRRDNDMALAAFLPTSVREVTMRLGGRTTQPELREFRARPYIRVGLHFAPQARRRIELSYTVPNAATRFEDGLTYHLDVDPQPLVDPAEYRVEVHYPTGFEAREVPAGWSSDRTRAAYEATDFQSATNWRLKLTER